MEFNVCLQITNRKCSPIWPTYNDNRTVLPTASLLCKDSMIHAPLYPNVPQCTELNTRTKAKLSGKGPRESFAAYVEWVGFPFTLGFAEEDCTSPSPKSDFSKPPSQHMVEQFTEPEPAVMFLPESMPELSLARYESRYCCLSQRETQWSTRA